MNKPLRSNKYKTIIIQFIKGESLIKFLHKNHILVSSTNTALAFQNSKICLKSITRPLWLNLSRVMLMHAAL